MERSGIGFAELRFMNTFKSIDEMNKVKYPFNCRSATTLRRKAHFDKLNATQGELHANRIYVAHEDN